MAAYKGESGRNGFRQGEEHLDNKATKDEEKSILWAHSVHHHNSREDMVYMMRVTGAYNEPLDRQIMERVQISNFQGPVLMNRRNKMGGIRIDKMRYRRWEVINNQSTRTEVPRPALRGEGEVKNPARRSPGGRRKEATIHQKPLPSFEFLVLSPGSYFDQQELWSETIHCWLTAG